MNEQTTVRALYSKLLRLYPRQFRERLGESMEQTFNDLVNERRQTSQGLSGFILWTFAETTGGIIQEHISLVKQGDAMQPVLRNLKLPAFIGFLLVLPLMIMEVINRRSFNEGFPVLLFVIMWLLPVMFVLILMPLMRNLRQAGNSILAGPGKLLLSVTLLVLIAIMWTGALIDQMPCFLGVPNCD